jgi:hypothetical protein
LIAGGIAHFKITLLVFWLKYRLRALFYEFSIDIRCSDAPVELSSVNKIDAPN